MGLEIYFLPSPSLPFPHPPSQRLFNTTLSALFLGGAPKNKCWYCWMVFWKERALKSQGYSPGLCQTEDCIINRIQALCLTLRHPRQTSSKPPGFSCRMRTKLPVEGREGGSSGTGSLALAGEHHTWSELCSASQLGGAGSRAGEDSGCAEMGRSTFTEGTACARGAEGQGRAADLLVPLDFAQAGTSCSFRRGQGDH